MDAVQRMFNKLEAGSAAFNCSGFIDNLDPLVRTAIYTRLLFERLKRKNDSIIDIYRNEGQSWEQVFHVLLFRFLGAPANTSAFETLARRAPYTVAKLYLRTPSRLEALLIGASGLLDLYPNDQYTLNIRTEFEYLSEKHNIRKMHPSEWVTERIYPYNHPVLRMAQAAAILSQPAFGIECILGCRTAEDAERLLCREASDYWTTHFRPSTESEGIIKRLGRDKAYILAINAIAPLQFSHGSYINSDRLRDRALNLLDGLKPENNIKVRCWRNNGLLPRSAFETQALIQLGDEYCRRQRCRECPVGLQIVKTLEDACKVEENK